MSKRKPFYLRKSFTGEHKGAYYQRGKFNHYVERRNGVTIRQISGRRYNFDLTSWLRRCVIGGGYKFSSGEIVDGGRVIFRGKATAESLSTQV